MYLTCHQTYESKKPNSCSERTGDSKIKNMLMMPSTPSAFELFKDLIDLKISKVSTGKKNIELFNSGKLADNETFSIFLFIIFPLLEKYSFVCSDFY